MADVGDFLTQPSLVWYPIPKKYSAVPAFTLQVPIPRTGQGISSYETYQRMAKLDEK